MRHASLFMPAPEKQYKWQTSAFFQSKKPIVSRLNKKGPSRSCWKSIFLFLTTTETTLSSYSLITAQINGTIQVFKSISICPYQKMTDFILEKAETFSKIKLGLYFGKARLLTQAALHDASVCSGGASQTRGVSLSSRCSSTEPGARTWLTSTV